MTNIVTEVPAKTLRERMLEDMDLRRLARATQRNYIRDVARFAAFLGRPPDTATREDLRRFQIVQHEAGVNPPLRLIRPMRPSSPTHYGVTRGNAAPS